MELVRLHGVQLAVNDRELAPPPKTHQTLTTRLFPARYFFTGQRRRRPWRQPVQVLLALHPRRNQIPPDRQKGHDLHSQSYASPLHQAARASRISVLAREFGGLIAPAPPTRSHRNPESHQNDQK